MQVALVNRRYSEENQGATKLIAMSDLNGVGEVYDTKDVPKDTNESR